MIYIFFERDISQTLQNNVEIAARSIRRSLHLHTGVLIYVIIIYIIIDSDGYIVISIECTIDYLIRY